MKTTITFLFTSLVFGLFSQNYEAFQSNHQYHYAQSLGGTRDYIFSVKMDSSEIIGSDTVLYNYKQVSIFPADISSFSLDGKCLGRESWVGKNSIKRVSSIHEFITQADDTIRIKTNAIQGETWVFCPNNSTTYFEAAVSNIYETTVLGVLDSIKEITLNLYDLSHNLQSSAFNGKTILLSKNHGLIQLYDFYHFPAQIKEFTMVGKDTEGASPLKEEELYQFEVGDYLVYTSSSIYDAEYRIITSKTVSANSYTYGFKQILQSGNSYSYNPSASITYNFTIDNYRLMGEFETFAYNQVYPFDGMVINYVQNGEKYLNSYHIEPFDGSCWYNDWYNGVDATSNFKQGYGLVNDLVNSWQEAYDEWGNPYTEYYTTQRQLYYYVPTIGASYGTLISPFSNGIFNADKTKSCDGIIQFQLVDLGYDSLVWHFGDGTTSNDLDPLHVYADTGSYTVSLEVFSPFGNKTLTFFYSIFVGDNFSDQVIKTQHSLANACNNFLFKDITDTVTTRLWTFPDGSTSSDPEISFTFDTIGTYNVILNNSYAFCTRSKTLTVEVETINPPVAADCPITQDGNNLYYYEMNGKVLKGSSTYSSYTNVLGDSLRRGCNFFQLYAGYDANVKLFVGYYDLIDIGGGLFDPWYTGMGFNLWIDYNNDGVFQTSEQVTSGGCGSGYDIDFDNLFGTASFLVPQTAVKNQVLRMRLVDGTDSDPCNEFVARYDFSVMISDYTGLEEKQLAELVSVSPNPTNDKLTVKLNNYAAISNLTLSIQNVLGETVFSNTERNLSPFTGKSISMEHLANGVYFLKVTADGKTQTVKVVKE